VSEERSSFGSFCLREVRLVNGMGDSSAVSAQAWGNWTEASSEKRSGNYPLRRSYQTGRPGEASPGAVDMNGVHKDNAQAVMNQRLDNHSHNTIVNGNGHAHVLASNFKCRGGTPRSKTSYGEKASVASTGKSGKISLNVYRILISLVAILFLIETVAQGFVFLLFRHADLQAESVEIFPRVFGSSSEQAATSGADVRFVPRNVVERLLLSKGKATVAELRKEARSPVRFPRLALVRI
jgi:hypothetical protein